MSKTAELTPKKNLKGTLILFLAIVIGIFLFMLAAILIGQSRGPLMPAVNKYHTMLAIVMAFIAFACLFLGKRLFEKEISAAKNSLNPLNEKLNNHRSALIKYLVICEMPVMLSIVLFLLSGNFTFQIYAGVFLGFMLTVTPTRKKIAEQLELDGREQQALL